MTEIDIILPYFNGSKYIKEQLDSLLNSNLDGINIKIIIINDASTKKETEYLKSIIPAAAKYIENEKNLGVIRSIEKAMTSSNAPYVMFCDQDDVWLPNKIRHSLNKIQQIEKDNIPSLIYTDLVISGPNLEERHPSMHEFYKHDHESIKPSVLFHNIVTGCTIIINRKLIEIALPFPKNITMHDHWLALCATFAGQIALLDEVTILYRQHGNNQVGTPNKRLIWKWLTLPKLREHLKMKSDMADCLADRLAKVGKKDESEFLKKIVTAINAKDILYLIRIKAISGNLIRKIATSGLLILQKQE